MRFSPRTFRILEDIAIWALTPKVVEAYSLEQAHFKERASFLLQKNSAPFQFVLFLSLWIFEITCLFVRGSFFTSLHPGLRKKYFESWFVHPPFLKYLLSRPLSVVIYSAYYSDEKVSASLGFPEKPFHSGHFEKNIPNGVVVVDDVGGALSIETEICVIGSGAGGAVVAKELAEKGHQVIILEEGGYFPKSLFQQSSSLERNGLIYRDGGMVATLGSPLIILPTGKAVGGTTIINSGTCFRTPDSVLKKWQKDFGLDSLTDQNLSPYFDRVENILKIQPVTEENLGGNNKIVRRGIEKLGLHGGPLDRNAQGCVGSGECIFGCPTGAKQSTEQSYLPMAFGLGVKLYASCKVEKINQQADKIKSVSGFFKKSDGTRGRSFTVHAQKFVVCAGTINTPLLLKDNKIAQGNRALGKNLTIHPTTKMMGVFDEVIDGWKGVPQGFSLTDYEHLGLMFETVFFPPWLLATSVCESGDEHRQIMQAYRHLSIFGFLVHDDPNGWIKRGPDGSPLIFYFLGDREKKLMVEGIKILGELFFAAGAKKIYSTLRRNSSFANSGELQQLDVKKIKSRDIESAAFHPLGTCRMGRSHREGVVDVNGRVFGMDNLWIADGSIFPTSLGVNPQVTIMAFASRIADKIHDTR